MKMPSPGINMTWSNIKYQDVYISEGGKTETYPCNLTVGDIGVSRQGKTL